MPVPKRKTSKSRRDKRSACKFLRPKAFAHCKNCAAPAVPHVVCENCGYYKGRKILKTKLDRALKRGETRKTEAQAAQRRHEKATQASEAEQASDVHEHQS